MNRRPLKYTFLAPSKEYELLDCGRGRKLERFGKVILDRPEVEAQGQAALPPSKWRSAHWQFEQHKGQTGRWNKVQGGPEDWHIHYQIAAHKLRFKLQLTSFKHLGIFPEQAENWRYIQKQLKRINGEKKVLNLFAYTGAASIVAAACGARVTNVDSVKQILNWAKNNAEQNRIESIRWILEDARSFVAKAVRRGEQYHGIIMDPPAFGHGTKNKNWKIERDLHQLLEDSMKLLHKDKHFFILNSYSPKMSADNLHDLVRSVPQFPKKFELSTLAIKTNHSQVLPFGNLLRFSQ